MKYLLLNIAFCLALPSLSWSEDSGGPDECNTDPEGVTDYYSALTELEALGIPGSPHRDLDAICGDIRSAKEQIEEYIARCQGKTSQTERIRRIFEGHHQVDVVKDMCTEGSPVRDAYLKHHSCLNELNDRVNESCIQPVSALSKMIHPEDGGSEPTGPTPVNKEACCTFEFGQACVGKFVKEKCGTEAKDFSVQAIRRNLKFLVDGCPNLGVTDLESCKSFIPKNFLDSLDGNSDDASSDKRNSDGASTMTSLNLLCLVLTTLCAIHI